MKGPALAGAGKLRAVMGRVRKGMERMEGRCNVRGKSGEDAGMGRSCLREARSE